MKFQFRLLQHNFQEMYSVQKSQLIEDELVGSPFCNKLYNIRSGWGHVWRVIYLILGKSRRIKRLYRVVERTHAVFSEHAESMQDILTQYTKLMVQKSKGESPTAKNYVSCCWQLTRWYDATHMFLAYIHKQPTSPLHVFLKRSLAPTQKDSFPFHCEILFKRISKVQKILDIEGLLQKPLPYAALHKLAISAQLDSKDKKEIDQWVRFLNECPQLFSVRFFHRFLHSLISEFSQEGDMPNLTKLEMGLIDRECKIFLQKDLKHLKWRQQLRPGSTVICNNKPFVLGERVGAKKEGFDQTIHYSIIGDPHKILTIGVNEAVLSLKKALSEKQGFAVKIASYLEVDASGKCALVEKLSETLSHFTWTSQKTQLSATDQDLIAPLSGSINWLVKKKVSPHHLSPRHLMFDAKGELKSLKVVLRTPSSNFDFNFLENFVFECSAGNSRVFKHLMEASGLNGHPYAKFYKKVAKNAQQRNSTTVSMQANLYSITDSRIEEQAKKLYQQIIELELECTQKIQQQCQIGQEKLIRVVSHKILSYYKMSGAAGVIWPDLKQEVVDAVIKQQKLTVSLERQEIKPDSSPLLAVSKVALLPDVPRGESVFNEKMLEGLIAS